MVINNSQVRQDMAEISLQKWMKRQGGSAEGFVIAMLYPEYSNQAAVEGFDVDTELELMNQDYFISKILTVSLVGAKLRCAMGDRRQGNGETDKTSISGGTH